MATPQGLIAGLQQGRGSDRRLDSEVIAYVLAPAGSRLDPIADIDGWAILPPDATDDGGKVWMTAADVPAVTLSLDFVQELLATARPNDGAQLMARAFRRLEPAAGDSAADFASQAARAVLAELVGVLAAERRAAGRSASASRSLQPANAPESRAA